MKEALNRGLFELREFQICSCLLADARRFALVITNA